MEALKKWIISTTDAAVVKDEMILKLFCIQVLDKELIKTLLTEMEKRYDPMNTFLDSVRV
jgi:PadR family transcriptional regulator, regulatory protein AphA